MSTQSQHVSGDSAPAPFRVGQQGTFTLLDAYFEPIETVHATILQLMPGKDALYAMLKTERGVRPGRLARRD